MAQIVAEDLRERYPGPKLFVVDTLCACCGVAALIEPVAKMREAGCSIEDARDWLEENKRRVCHWISVDDLGHLYRGGRLSAAGAVVGTALGIKPIIDLNSEGKLVTAGKGAGQKQCLWGAGPASGGGGQSGRGLRHPGRARWRRPKSWRKPSRRTTRSARSGTVPSDRSSAAIPARAPWRWSSSAGGRTQSNFPIRGNFQKTVRKRAVFFRFPAAGRAGSVFKNMV
ncbi:MAG: DegV family protein [Acutalibacteraceae bacterium]